MNKPTKFIDHHSGGTNANPKASTQHHTVDMIDAWHKTRWNGFTSKVHKNGKGEYYHCGYHYVIEATGKTTQTRGHDEEGAHCIGMNTSSIGILTVGNFDKGVDKPTPAQIQARVDLHKKLREEFPELTLYDAVPHRKYAVKSCFGSGLSDTYWQDIIRLRTKQRDLIVENEDYAKKRHMLQVAIQELSRLVVLLQNLVTLKRLSIRE